ncbi:MAG: hypothetical protein L3J14_04070 [Flavobacteriaceae bacterium]|nr:hypothetical protein [Flavobacteriaceae bacterium]
MKIFIHLFFILTLVGCKTKQTTLITEKQEFKATTNCPEDGVCTVELIPNSSLIVKSDEFGNTYTIIEKGEKTIFKYTFSRNVDKQYVDGHYIEEIYAEFDKELPEINLKDKNLSNVKLLFNRMCYCKGSAGFYHIQKGNLSFRKTKKNTFNFQLNFTMDKVPQVITSINETFTLD